MILTDRPLTLNDLTDIFDQKFEALKHAFANGQMTKFEYKTRVELLNDEEQQALATFAATNGEE